MTFCFLGNTVFCQAAAATPNALIDGMIAHAHDKGLKDITVCHIHTEGPAAYCKPENAKIFRSFSFFMGANVRKSVAEGEADCTGIFLQDIPKLFYKKIVKPNVCLIHVSAPDRHGNCSLGTSVDCVRAALLHTNYIVGMKRKLFQMHIEYPLRPHYSQKNG